MSTPANIAEFDKQGRMHIANVGMDGDLDPGSVGSVLLTAYNNPKKVDQLVKLGNLAHVGYTPKQANVFKEAGDNWTEHTGIGSTVSGKDASGQYTSPKQARANRHKEDKWFSQVDNYTHAYNRDWGRAQGEEGTTAKVDMDSKNYLSNALESMNDNSKWASEYNYLYDGTKNKWYYNNPSSDKLKPLDQAVNLQDQQEVSQDYQHFKQHPTNPKLPQMNSNQIHKSIHEAIYGPKGTHNMYGLKNDYRSDTKQGKAQVKNLQQIDKWVTKHPDVHLYQNDLNLNHHLGNTVANNEKRFNNMQNTPKAQLAKIRNGLISKYIQNPNAKPVNPDIDYEKPLARYGQPIYNGQTGAITDLKNMYGTKKLSKPIPRNKVQETLKTHGKQINKTLNYYKNNPKHRALLMKSHGYMNKDDIDTYLRDDKIIDMYHHQGKLSDHQRDLAKKWYVKDTAADDMKDNMCANAGVKTNPFEASDSDMDKEDKIHGDAQRMLGIKDVPKNSCLKPSWNNPDADFIDKFSYKLDNDDTTVETYEDEKKNNDRVDIPTKKPKLVQQLDAYDEHQMEDNANKVSKIDSDSMMSAFKAARGKGVSKDTHRNKQNSHKSTKAKYRSINKPAHKASHKINHNGPSIG